jgi:hypothetical protein
VPRKGAAHIVAVCAFALALGACGDDSAPDLGALAPGGKLDRRSDCVDWRNATFEEKRRYVAATLPRYLSHPRKAEVEAMTAQVEGLCEVAGSAKVENSTLSELIALRADRVRLKDTVTCSVWRAASEQAKSAFLDRSVRRALRNPTSAEQQEISGHVAELCDGSPDSSVVEAVSVYAGRARLAHEARCDVWEAASDRARQSYVERTLPRYLPKASAGDVDSALRAVNRQCAGGKATSLAIVEYVAAEAASLKG